MVLIHPGINFTTDTRTFRSALENREIEAHLRLSDQRGKRCWSPGEPGLINRWTEVTESKSKSNLSVNRPGHVKSPLPFASMWAHAHLLSRASQGTFFAAEHVSRSLTHALATCVIQAKIIRPNRKSMSAPRSICKFNNDTNKKRNRVSLNF